MDLPTHVDGFTNIPYATNCGKFCNIFFWKKMYTYTLNFSEEIVYA